MIGVAILGSTGTIGENTLDVIARHPDRFRVVALAARSSVEAMSRQCLRWQPRYAALADAEAAARLRGRLRSEAPGTEVLGGEEALATVAALPEADYVMAAIVGAAGLLPTLAAARAGKRILLANKEALVMAGPVFMQAARAGGAQILPIDSEHNAVFQCLPLDRRPSGDESRDAGRNGGEAREAGVRCILLTASGGPFRRLPAEQLAAVTPEQACRHPNWVMGRKISVDSATLMNKGLEVIEACRLFDLEPAQVRVVVHPQSIVHSLVEYTDGSVLAQLGQPDMRTPIAYGLGWPDARLDAGVERLDLCATARLEFEPADERRFPCLRLAREALRYGGTAPAVLNAANEVAVAGFLGRDLRFTGIAPVIEATLSAVPAGAADDLEQVLAADRAARIQAGRFLKEQAT